MLSPPLTAAVNFHYTPLTVFEKTPGANARDFFACRPDRAVFFISMTQFLRHPFAPPVL